MIRQHMAMEEESNISEGPQSSKAPSLIAGDPGVTVAHPPDKDQLALAFLRDVVVHPECGIAERYKRLGISVRQGQKLKFQLLEATMIEDHEEFTHTGRIRRIQLTEKGRHFTAKAGA